MINLNFRAKLLLAMMLLVAGVTVATLLITENQVRISYERHFQQSFGLQIESFLQEREARLAPVRERVANAAASPRVIAAMENAGQPGVNQQDVDDLYQNGIDQLQQALKAYAGGPSNLQPGFFFFMNRNGQLLLPSATVKLPFTMPGLRRITPQIETIGNAVSQSGAQQAGYLAPRDEPGGEQIREMIFTPIVDQVNHRQLGVLAVGFPLPETGSKATRTEGHPPTPFVSSDLTGEERPAASAILSGIWLDDRFFSSSVPTNDQAQVEADISRGLQASRQTWNEVIFLRGIPHQLYCQALHLGSAFPPAYQVCLYSLAAAGAEEQRFQHKILLSGIVALLGALGLGLFISRSLAVPLQELVAGTTEIERGNYAVRVPVRGRHEVAHLAQAFNSMVKRVQASNIAQEERIAERTRELAELKHAEEALRRSESSLREAQRIAHLGNWDWNVVTNELRWSNEIYQIFGLTPREFRATYEAFLERVHPEDREMVQQAVRQSLEAGKLYSLDHRVLRPDGEIRIVHEQAELLRDDTGNVIGMVGTVQDITEAKRLEAEFLRAQRMDSIGALASGLAHDLNNALSPILMGIQLIRSKTQDPDSKKMLAAMEANTYRGADMVRQVLTFARGQEGARELLDLGRLIQEMAQVARQTLPKSITVTALVPPDLWQVAGNSTQIHQILLNLCINARDAMPNGGELTIAADNVELGDDEARGIPNATPGTYATLLVSDTGTGIPPEILPRIFEPFFTTKGVGKGTGLGLSTIARIVRNHGGFLNVKSEMGEGTTFEVYLPRAQAAPAPATRVSETALPKGREELILLVEDDRSVREMVASSLVEYGYRVVSASGGAELAALLTQHEGDLRLVLANLNVPATGGVTVLEAIHSRQPHLPTILMSGELDGLEKSKTGNVAAFLPKPFSLDQLLTSVASALVRNPKPE
jgi:two-component system, cell cycle sensor histidine kinase and response regulator CckA